MSIEKVSKEHLFYFLLVSALKNTFIWWWRLDRYWHLSPFEAPPYGAWSWDARLDRYEQNDLVLERRVGLGLKLMKILVFSRYFT